MAPPVSVSVSNVAFIDTLNEAAIGDVTAATADIAENFANFSTEMLQQASNALALSNAVAETDPSAFVISGSSIDLAVADTVSFINSTLESQCLQQLEHQQQQQQQNTPADTIKPLGCPTFFDTVLCWPQTPPNTFAVLPCLEELNSIHYDTTQNATRFCYANGTWANYSNYEKCHHNATVPDFPRSAELTSYIYCCGYFLSFTALILALIVFLCFKDLKCLRNTIHANLFLTYILSALLWILTLFLQSMNAQASHNQSGCITLVIMFHYFNLTNFFWMFVEGLYLYTLVVQTFSSDNIKFPIYAFIGWGCPAIIVIVWSIAKIHAPTTDYINFNGLEVVCAWMKESHIDWIIQGPTFLVLLLNLIFLIRIMWVLITKLRSANTLETRQYHKASKALLVLIPLFGITYILVLTGPTDGVISDLFEIIRITLISTQGFSVSLLFCFLNTEVRQTLRHRFDRWRDNRNIRRNNSQRNRRYRLSKDYSQRSRTESLRLTSSSPGPTTNHVE